jgi:hypothetical protein
MKIRVQRRSARRIVTPGMISSCSDDLVARLDWRENRQCSLQSISSLSEMQVFMVHRYKAGQVVHS